MVKTASRRITENITVALPAECPARIHVPSLKMWTIEGRKVAFAANEPGMRARCGKSTYFRPMTTVPGRRYGPVGAVTKKLRKHLRSSAKALVILSDRSREIIRLFEELERKRDQVSDSLAATPFRQTAPKLKLIVSPKRRPF